MLRRVSLIALLMAAPAVLLAQRPVTPRPPTPVRHTLGQTLSAVDPALFRDLKYRMVGPGRGGRVTTVTGVPSQPHTFYMGSTGGGVWRTTDAGQSWFNLTDGQFAVGSMGAVEVSLSNPKVIYAGTGSDGLRSNVSIGNGVYKSTDEGKTWTHVGLAKAGNIGGVRVHPTNPDLVYVAAIGNPFTPNPERGIFRSKDGGATWQKILFISDSTGGVDIEFKPNDPTVVYAAMWRAERKPWTIISGAKEGGFYKSTDGGDTWKKVTAGLPTELIGKGNVAVSAANPRRVYLLLEAKPGGGLYRSDDGGESFTLASSYGPLISRPFYYTNITADPRNADVLYVGSEGFYKSTDAGRNWRTVNPPHGDNHDLWINPNDSGLMIESNDGGATVSLNGARTWSTQYNQPTAEIYQVYVDNQYPYRLYGAQQDNSTLIVPSLPLTSGRPDDPMQEWKSGPGCETGPIFPHLTNPDTVYGGCKGQFSRMSMRSGQEKQYWVGAQSLYGNPGNALIYRFQRVAPMEYSPRDPKTIYYGSQYLHRTRDEGVTWERISPDLTWNPPERQQYASGEPITIDVTGEEYYSVLYAIRESTLEPGVIWTGANDGPFHVTRDDGKTWTKITPQDQPPGCRVQNIEPSPHMKGAAYYAVLCYQLGDFRPYIWKTEDYGKTWRLLTPGTNGIPLDQPTRVVREDPNRPGLLYAGTEFGMFISFDDGRRWQSFQQNLPAVPVTDIKIHRKDLVLSTQGRAFWILDNLTPLHQLSQTIVDAGTHLYKPREATRVRWFGFGGVESSRNNPADPQYPAYGATIDYVIANPNAGDVRLDVTDAAGKLVRSFTSGAPTESSTRESVERLGAPRLPNAAGHNRFVWDLTAAGPWETDARRSGRGGPSIVPGTYMLKITNGAVAETAPLIVREEPRMVRDNVTLADLREQYEHNVRARDLVSEVNRLVVQLDAEREKAKAQNGGTLVRLDSLRAKLVTPTVRYSKPELQAHIQYLYSMTTQADQKIGRDAIARLKVLRKELDDREAEFRGITGQKVVQ